MAIKVRDVGEPDIAWLPQYVLNGFHHFNYTPSIPRIEATIRACMASGFAMVAEDGGEPVGILGGVVTPMFWAERDALTVVALRSTKAGAGMALLREMLRRMRGRIDVMHALVTFAPERADDARIGRAMRRLGGRPVVSYLFFNEE